MPPLVTAQETAKILAFLSIEDRTLDQVSAAFKEAWPQHRYSRLKALFALLLYLQEGVLKQKVQRCAALYLLHDCCHLQPPKRNPFAPFLIQATQDPLRPLQERKFICHLLLEDSPPAGTVSEVTEHFGQQSEQDLPSAEHLWEELLKRHALRAAEADKLSASILQGTSSTDEVERLLTLEAQLDISPPFMRPKPPMLPVQPGELKWIHPQLPQLIRWDHSMGKSRTTVTELQDLLKHALAQPLLPTQQRQVLEELEADRKLALSLNLEAATLPQLVEQNPAIAVEVLLRLVQLGRGGECLPALGAMEMSLHSMEVVNRLSAAGPLPPDFLRSYITHCIAACQAAQEDKFVQTRRVRLVCVFLQSLIKNKVLDVQELFYEIQAFCIEFSRMREAAGLFRLLKNLENGDAASPEASKQ